MYGGMAKRKVGRGRAGRGVNQGEMNAFKYGKSHINDSMIALHRTKQTVSMGCTSGKWGKCGGGVHECAPVISIAPPESDRNPKGDW